MTASKWIILIAGFGIASLLIQCGQEEGHQLIYEEEIDFDHSVLHELNSFRNSKPEDFPTKDWAVIIYVSKLSCTTCVSREVAHLNGMHDKYNNVDFMMIVQGWDEIYLRNMVRVGKVRYPILLEEIQGQVGLPPDLSISLVDIKRAKIICQYFPSPDPSLEDRILTFERIVAKNLAKSKS